MRNTYCLAAGLSHSKNSWLPALVMLLSAFVLSACGSETSEDINPKYVSEARALSPAETRGLSAPPQAYGDLIITEVFNNPSGSSDSPKEWFEIYNTTTAALT
jgi:hypothetical protein